MLQKIPEQKIQKSTEPFDGQALVLCEEYLT